EYAEEHQSDDTVTRDAFHDLSSRDGKEIRIFRDTQKEWLLLICFGTPKPPNAKPRRKSGKIRPGYGKLCRLGYCSRICDSDGAALVLSRLPCFAKGACDDYRNGFGEQTLCVLRSRRLAVNAGTGTRAFALGARMEVVAGPQTDSPRMARPRFHD